MTDKKKIAPLLSKKQTCVASQKRNHAYLNENHDTITSETLKVRLQLLEQNYQDYRANHYRIMSDFPSQEEINDKIDFEDEYVTIKAMILSLEHDSSEDNPGNGSTRAKRQINVPVISLPSFSGKYTEWVSFWNTFTTLVDQTNLNIIEKFQHLKNCLKDPASLVINGLEISSENYEIAKQNLIDRYSNKRISFQAHIREIMDIPCVQKNSSENLHRLVDSINVHYNALLSIGSKDKLAEALLLNLVIGKMDNLTYTKWEETAASVNDVPSWPKLKEFLDMRCQALDNISSNSSHKPANSQQQQNSSTNRSNQRNVTLTSSSNTCVYCSKKNHSIFKCFKFRYLSTDSKLKEITALKLCSNCLKSSHPENQDCPSTETCHMCKESHHTLLHDVFAARKSSDETPEKDPKLTVNVAHKSSQIILATAMVQVRDALGFVVNCRALLDSASQTHFMSSHLATRLKLTQQKVNIPIGGIGDVSTTVNHKVSASVCSSYKLFNADLEFLVLPVITDNQPIKPINVKSLQIPSQCTLADPDFSVSKPVDLLLGAEVFYHLLCAGRVQLGDNLPILQETVFGYVVSGQITKPVALTSFLINDPQQSFEEEESFAEIKQKFYRVEKLESPERQKMLEKTSVENPSQENLKLCCNHITVKPQFNDYSASFKNSTLLNYESLGSTKSIADPKVSIIGHFAPYHCINRTKISSNQKVENAAAAHLNLCDRSSLKFNFRFEKQLSISHILSLIYPVTAPDKLKLSQQWLILNNHLKIPILSSQKFVTVEIPEFSESYLLAYGCCLYTSPIDINSSTSVSLVCAKSKSSQIRTQSLFHENSSINFENSLALAKVNFVKLQSLLVLINRIINSWLSLNAAKGRPKIAGESSISALNLIRVIKFIQRSSIKPTFILLSHIKLPTKSSIKCLTSSLNQGLIQIGSRWQKANFTESTKNHIFAPNLHSSTRILCRTNRYLCSLHPLSCNRWCKDYIVHRQLRSNWTQPSFNIEVPQFSLIKEDNHTTQKWQISLIIFHLVIDGNCQWHTSGLSSTWLLYFTLLIERTWFFQRRRHVLKPIASQHWQSLKY